MKKKILVRGPLLTRSGYGEHTRLVLRSLKEYQDRFDIYALAVTWGGTNWLFDDNEERDWFDEILRKTIIYTNEGGQFDISVQVTIPNEWERMAPVNVGVTAGIETNRVAPAWIEKSKIMDKIIVPSEHSKNVYEQTTYDAQNPETNEIIKDFRCTTPIDVIHYPVRDAKQQKLKLDLEFDFNFLTVAQWGPRKNLDNLITWFVEEFIDIEAGLVIKASLTKNNNLDRLHCERRVSDLLAKYPERKCKVYLLHGNMSDEEMLGLYKHPKIKAIATTTHGEGFGLPLFEAAHSGLPVIAPDWSGHVDFLYKTTKDKKDKEKKKSHFAKVEFTMQPIQEEAVWEGVLEKGTLWCYPEQGSFKMRLREVFKEHGRFKKQAKALQSWIKEEFTEKKAYKKMADAIYEEEEFEVTEWLNNLEVQVND